MKAAFHFDAGHNHFGNPYGENVENLVFAALLENPALSVFSKIYAGDLLLHLASGNENDFNDTIKNWIEGAQNVQVLGFASSQGKHSFFDKYHNFEQACRVADWRDKFGEMLGFVADNVVTRLGDVAPQLGEKLWAAHRTFARSETNEELAQVWVSCRRIFQYVADSLFPPRETQPNEQKLGAGNYRNRLKAFADEQSKSETNLDVICSSLDLWEAHLQKLDQLANKGVHGEVTKEGTRRCLLRTIMLLDDLVSLRSNQFQIKTELDFSILEQKGQSNDR